MKECPPIDVCQFNKFRQPRYFHGMLLDDQDFRDEHEYHAQKRRLLNRMLHGSGVVCGLLFLYDAKTDEKTFTITCGLALDCSGNEIYVPDNVTVTVPVPSKQPKEPCTPKNNGKEICYRIRIAYTEEDTDLKQVHLPGGGCDDKTCKATRKREGYCIKFTECECPESPKPTDVCKDLIAGFDKPIECGCGCACSCGTEHWVSLGTVHVTSDGKIVGNPSYECRDYVLSGNMLKQLLTQVPPPATGECACPDQFERLKNLLSLICNKDEGIQALVKNVNSELANEASKREAALAERDRALNERLGDEAKQREDELVKLDKDFGDRFEGLQNRIQALEEARGRRR